MGDEAGRDFLAVTIAEFEAWRAQAEKAVAQTGEDDLNRTLDADGNSLAVIMRHVGNNLRSRWTDFLTTDGEKPDRNRDGEFENTRPVTRDELFAIWNEGWSRVLETLHALKPEDLGRTVKIRSEPHTVTRAIQRSLAHTASHCGQVILLAKHFAGARWTSISIPRGESKAFEARHRAKFGG